jgi:hypothetical protein
MSFLTVTGPRADRDRLYEQMNLNAGKYLPLTVTGP